METRVKWREEKRQVMGVEETEGGMGGGGVVRGSKKKKIESN